MIVGIVGSRYYAVGQEVDGKIHYPELNDFDILEKMLEGLPVDSIVSGGAKGADTVAEQYAEKYLIPIQVIKPDWDKHGKGAGFKRNIEIVKAADCFVALWNGISKGSKHDLELIMKSGKKAIVVITPEPGVYEFVRLN